MPPIKPPRLGVIHPGLLNCDTVREGAVRSSSYYMVISAVAHPELEEDANEARIVMVTAVMPPAWPPQAAEYTLAIRAKIFCARCAATGSVDQRLLKEAG